MENWTHLVSTREQVNKAILTVDHGSYLKTNWREASAPGIRERSSTLPRAATARAAPAPIAFPRRWSTVRLIVVDAHQPEAVRGVRAPIVVRPEPYVPVIVRFPFVIPAERVAAGFSGLKNTRGKRRRAVSIRAEAAPAISS